MKKPANDEMSDREIRDIFFDACRVEDCLECNETVERIKALITSREKRVAEEILSSIDEHDEDNYHGTYHYAISLGTYIELRKKYLGEEK